MSSRTIEVQSKYANYEIEASTVIEGIKQFEHYIFGIKFKIIINRKSF